MSNYTYCRTLKLDWKEASRLIGECAGKILDRTIHGIAGYEDDHYWGFQATTDRFTIAEIDKLIRFVNGNEEMERKQFLKTPENPLQSVRVCLVHCWKKL